MLLEFVRVAYGSSVTIFTEIMTALILIAVDTHVLLEITH
jgi:hypothetical protein